MRAGAFRLFLVVDLFNRGVSLAAHPAWEDYGKDGKIGR